jgi:aryl-alcohol dehydrogenase-like predicted oxidoreductase
MEYRRIGASGLAVSEIALGSWLTYGAGVDEADSTACIRTALDEGILFFDAADVYAGGEAERVLGKALAGEKRADLVVATKAYFPMSDNPNDRGLSRKHLHESLDASLRRLGMDYVDLFQCHRPDPTVSIAETVRAMDDLVRAGKTLYWGVSLWSAEEIAEACRLADSMNAVRPISNQPPYSLVSREIEASVLPWCRDNGIGQVVFSPLAEGLLTGKYRGGQVPEDSRAAHEMRGRFLRGKMTDGNARIVDGVADLANQAGLPLPWLALAWTLRDPGVSSAIVGASRPEQVRENARAAGVKLDDDLLRKIQAVLTGH